MAILASAMTLLAAASLSPISVVSAPQSGSAAVPVPVIGRTGRFTRLVTSCFWMFAASMTDCSAACLSCNARIASSIFLRASVLAALAASSDSENGLASTEPISTLPSASPWMRTLSDTRLPGRSRSTMVWSPEASSTFTTRVTSAPSGKTVTASIDEFALMSAAKAGLAATSASRETARITERRILGISG